jgi:hypothetical protein
MLAGLIWHSSTADSAKCAEKPGRVWSTRHGEPPRGPAESQEGEMARPSGCPYNNVCHFSCPLGTSGSGSDRHRAPVKIGSIAAIHGTKRFADKRSGSWSSRVACPKDSNSGYKNLCQEVPFLVSMSRMSTARRRPPSITPTARPATRDRSYCARSRRCRRRRSRCIRGRGRWGRSRQGWPRRRRRRRPRWRWRE